uniref:Uncharacterized protein n=1 Tax=Oryza meridionalis TaxID=40149 RepID=A0A0E0CM74_9ORYZ
MAEKHNVDRQLGYSARRSFTRAGRRTPARDDDGGAPPFPGYMHGVDGVGQGQVLVHEHAQGMVRRRRGGRLLGEVLPVRRPSAIADPIHAADLVHRQRHRLHEVQPAGGGAAVAAGEGAHDADEVPVRRSPRRHSFGSEAALHHLHM